MWCDRAREFSLCVHPKRFREENHSLRAIISVFHQGAALFVRWVCGYTVAFVFARFASDLVRFSCAGNRTVLISCIQSVFVREKLAWGDICHQIFGTR